MMNTLTTEENVDRVDMAIAEYFDLVDAGQSISHDEFIGRHPDLRDELLAFFDASDEIESLAGPTLVEYSQAYSSADTSALLETHSAATTTIDRTRPTLEAGTEFGRYRIEGELGQGAMGSVYLAFDTQLARRVALKIPIFDEQKEPEMIERFYREARVAATLRSPNICPVFDVDKIKDVHFIAMAHIDGDPLTDLIRTNKTSPRDIAKIIGKLARALEKAHDSGVIHRDLKPSNVMIDAEGEPVVMDFGLARCTDQSDIRSTKVGAIIGSPAYMSPEQIVGNDVGPAADVYTLGVILHEMLTGQLPYQGSVISVIGQVMGPDNSPRSALANSDPHLARICETMMAKQLNERYSNMNEVARAIDAFLNNKTALAANVAQKPAPQEPVLASLSHPVNAIPIDALRDEPVAQPSSDLKVILSVLGVFCFVMLFIFVVLVGTYFLSRSDPPANETVLTPDDKEPKQLVGDDKQPKKIGPQENVLLPAPPVKPPAPARLVSLRYQLKEGDVFGYSIKVEAKRGTLTETLNGTLRYEVVESKKGQSRIRFDSRLTAKSNSRHPSFFTYERVSGRFPSFRDVVATVPKHEFVVDRNGDVLESDCKTQLPFGMGCLGQLPIEELGDGAKWSDEEEIKLKVTSSGRFRPSPIRRSDGSSSLTVESKTSSVLTGGKSPVIKNEYALSADEQSRFEAKGTGDVAFDKKLGRVTSKTISLEVTDAGQKIAVTLTCKLLDESELAEQQKRFETKPAPVSTKEQAHINALTMPEIPAELRIKSDTELKPGDSLEGFRGGKWMDVKVVEVLDNGQVKIHWVGFGSELDQPISRARLRLKK